MVDLQRAVYAPAELLELLAMHLSDSRLAEHLTSHFPSIAALRLYGQRAAASAARHPLAWAERQEDACAALDEACMALLSFAEAASRILQQPRIFSDAVRGNQERTDYIGCGSCCIRDITYPAFHCPYTPYFARKLWCLCDLAVEGPDGSAGRCSAPEL